MVLEIRKVVTQVVSCGKSDWLLEAWGGMFWNAGDVLSWSKYCLNKCGQFMKIHWAVYSLSSMDYSTTQSF